MSALRLAGVPGVLSAEEAAASADHLESLQLASGQLPWQAGGHCDPWNQVEAAMALTVCGRLDAARAAYAWLAATQLGDGSWFNYYRGDAVTDARLDTNVCAYLAVGLWHYLAATDDADFAAALFRVAEAGIEFVLRWQIADGTVRWSLDAQGRPEGYALLTGSASIFLSLRAGVAVAERLGLARPAWELAAGRLGHAVAHHPGAFAPKNEFAMDWYYPVLCGALAGDAAARRLDAGWERHVLEGRGVRCVSTSDWVTAAETAESALALDAAGASAAAIELLALTRAHRRADGAYFTGLAYPGARTFPGEETTSYTAAAVLLAADALSGSSRASGLFRPGALPLPPDLPEPGCPRA